MQNVIRRSVKPIVETMTIRLYGINERFVSILNDEFVTYIIMLVINCLLDT